MLVSARAKGGSLGDTCRRAADRCRGADRYRDGSTPGDSLPLAGLLAAIEAKDEEADRLLGRISDEIWNEVVALAST